MMRLAPTSLERILCLGAHCDDIEIGCGATLLTLLERHPNAHVDWIVLSSGPTRAAEARRAAAQLLGNAASDVQLRDFRNGYFPSVAADIKDFFESLKQRPAPDMILTHRTDDAHQDHRLVGELTWNTFRDHWILEYEVPKYDGDLGQPNLYVPVSEAAATRKVDVLMDCFASQHAKPWFTPDTFHGLMRLRGVECQAQQAEAFYTRKTIV